MKLTIYHTDCCENPREFAESRLICWHRRYDLGNRHNYDNPAELFLELAKEYGGDAFADYVEHQEETVWNDLYENGCCGEEASRIVDNAIMCRADAIVKTNCVILPVYMYEHSGVALNTGGYHCPWDSGQVGYIYYTKEQVQSLFNGSKELALQSLEMEVAIYGEYVNGDTYGYVVEDDDGETIDSCSGFIGVDHDTSGLREAVIEGGNDYDTLMETVEYAQ